MAYLGRAGWDNENTLQIQGERHLLLLQDMELIDGEHRLTPTGDQVRGELTLPVHMSLPDIAAQLNPGGADAVRAAAEEEFAAPAPPPPDPVVAEAPEPEEPEEDDDDNGYHTVVGGIGTAAEAGRGGAAPADRPARRPSPTRTRRRRAGADLGRPARRARVVYPPPVERATPRRS